MTSVLTGITLEEAAAVLETSSDYRVLRRFRPRDSYNVVQTGLFGPGFDEPTPLREGLFVDVETTGLDLEEDKIIALALVPFTFDRLGYVYDVQAGFEFFEDPGEPIPLEITELTGITDADVAGQRIDHVAVLQILGASDLVLAHNADFDRPMLERRVPEFAEYAWRAAIGKLIGARGGQRAAS